MSEVRELPKDLTTLTLKGKLLEFSIAGGTVVQVGNRTEAHIDSSRNAYGQVSSIQGSVFAARECWIRTPDGKEGKVRFPADGSLDAREGHEISVAVMRSAAVDQGRPRHIAVFNHTTGAWALLDQSEAVRELAGLGAATQAFAQGGIPLSSEDQLIAKRRTPSSAIALAVDALLGLLMLP
ncbi:hypothetical protein ACQUJS_18795, partial [Ralstonia pseudosolanacearum]